MNVYDWIDDAIEQSLVYLEQNGQEVDAGRWQGMPTEGKPDLRTMEVLNLQWTAKMPQAMEEAQDLINPNLPWAEDHFQERVAGQPTNPGEEYKNWPWWKGQDTKAMDDMVFSHTYQERFWPKYAGLAPGMEQHVGIRYPYGDLSDVVSHLAENPLSRQATFPIFFPEDTGVKHGGRVPCTLHYHFLRRRGRLHLWYPIRSCDAVRHFRDDIYMAVRLAQWVLVQLDWEEVELGFLNFNAYSFHAHKGDLHG